MFFMRKPKRLCTRCVTRVYQMIFFFLKKKKKKKGKKKKAKKVVCRPKGMIDEISSTDNYTLMTTVLFHKEAYSCTS